MERNTLGKIFLTFLISLFLSFLLQKIFQIDLQKIRDLVSSFGPAAPLAYTVLLTFGLTIPFNPISDLLVISLAALIFPPFVSVISTFTAHLLALSINYWVGRRFLNPLLKKILSKAEINKVENLSKRINLGLVFGFRFLLPLTAIGVDVVSYASGLIKLPFGKFLIVSIVPWTIFNVFYFYSSSYLREINAFLIMLPVGVLVLVPALILAFKEKDSLKDRLLKFFKIS